MIRKVKKDSFYLYKAYWSDEPFAHICGRRYVDRTEKKTRIKVYSNCDSVALYQNGKLLEEKQGNHIFEFTAELERENMFEAKTKNGCTDKMEIRLTDTPHREAIGCTRVARRASPFSSSIDTPNNMAI